MQERLQLAGKNFKLIDELVTGGRNRVDEFFFIKLNTFEVTTNELGKVASSCQMAHDIVKLRKIQALKVLHVVAEQS